MPAPSELKLEHVVIRVDDLDIATRDFTSLGFNVVYGGVHGSGYTHNALIHFQDGTFFELIAFRRRLLLKTLLNSGLLNIVLKNTDNHIKYRFVEGIRFPEGFMHSALLSLDITQDTEQANRRGLKTTKPIPFQREKPNGETVSWNIMSPFTDALPFLRDAYVPEQKMSEADTRHDNGALGISSVVYAVNDLAAAKSSYEQLLGTEIAISNQDGTQRAEFKLADVSMVLLPDNAQNSSRETPIQVTLNADENASTGQLPLEKTHSARIIF